MGKVKFTKTELKKQQDSLKQFQRFLPTLQLKKQQLQAEVRLSTDALNRNLADQQQLIERLKNALEIFGDRADMDYIESLVKVAKVHCGNANIAGICVPTYDKVEFAPLVWDLYDTDWFVDDAVQSLKDAVSLREAYKILAEQHRLLQNELRTTSQRVNLFEKVKIPECKENIRKIRIMLGDLDTSAVARSKIAKKKTALAS